MLKRTVKAAKTAHAMARIAAAGLLLSGSCTVVVDSNSEQCETRDDCAQFPGTICIEQACVVPEPGTPGECRTHRDCILKHDEKWICRARDEVCAPLLSEHCQTLVGDYENDHAIFIGSLLQTEGEFKSTGLPVQNAIELAIQDFEKGANGLPPAPGKTANRPLALVGCSSAQDPVAAARHLVDVVQVPAIIGASFSGVTIQVATEVTIPGKTILLSPSATSAAITQLQDDDLVWRTSPSDDLQAVAVQRLVPLVEDKVRESLHLDLEDPIRVAIAHKGDSYGRGLTDSVEEGLWFNGGPVEQNQDNYLRVDYGDPTPEDMDAAVEELLDFKPHIVMIFGSGGGVTGIFEPLEEQWKASAAHRPRYIFSDGGIVTELWQFVKNDNEMRKRILGTVPGTDNMWFGRFRSNYTTRIKDGTSPDVFGAAGGYDALYLLAYGMVSIGAKEITGPNLVQGLAAMAGNGEQVAQVEVGVNNITTAFDRIADGGEVNFQGASGPLDFDVTTGEAPSDIQVWCLPANDEGFAEAAVHSSLYLPAGDDELTGQIGPACD